MEVSVNTCSRPDHLRVCLELSVTFKEKLITSFDKPREHSKIRKSDVVASRAKRWDSNITLNLVDLWTSGNTKEMTPLCVGRAFEHLHKLDRTRPLYRACAHIVRICDAVLHSMWVYWRKRHHASVQFSHAGSHNIGSSQPRIEKRKCKKWRRRTDFELALFAIPATQRT